MTLNEFGSEVKRMKHVVMPEDKATEKPGERNFR